MTQGSLIFVDDYVDGQIYKFIMYVIFCLVQKISKLLKGTSNHFIPITTADERGSDIQALPGIAHSTYYVPVLSITTHK